MDEGGPQRAEAARLLPLRLTEVAAPRSGFRGGEPHQRTGQGEARRWIVGFLTSQGESCGPDTRWPSRSCWDQRFLCNLLDDPAQTGTRWLRLRPDSLIAKDLSYTV